MRLQASKLYSLAMTHARTDGSRPARRISISGTSIANGLFSGSNVVSGADITTASPSLLVVSSETAVGLCFLLSKHPASTSCDHR